MVFMTRCEPDCTCNRHRVYYRGGSKKCLPGCACSKHTETSRTPKVKKDGKCPPGCACGRHSDEQRLGIAARARARGPHSEEHKKKIGRGSRDAWARMTDAQRAEASRVRSENAKAYWEKEGLSRTGPKRRFGGNSTSQHELALVPYMLKLGYHHNTGNSLKLGRKAPDFIDMANRRVFEYFGSFWHPDRDEERRVIEYYAAKGWTCEVLWEDDLFKWLASHQELVTAEEHQFAWKAAHVNNGYRKPELVTT